MCVCVCDYCELNGCVLLGAPARVGCDCVSVLKPGEIETFKTGKNDEFL